jgi:SAM-dependent methyltransferase
MLYNISSSGRIIRHSRVPQSTASLAATSKASDHMSRDSHAISAEFLSDLACPRTRRPLELVRLSDSEKHSLKKIPRTGLAAGDYGLGDGHAFLTAGDHQYYAIAGGFPVLLYPEMLVTRDDTEPVDLFDPRYQEAYEEMKHYNSIGNDGADRLDDATLYSLMGRLANERPQAATFPDAEFGWIDSLNDGLSQLEAYSYLAPLEGKSFLQLGGSGSHAVKALLGGARVATLLTPMLGEARQGRALARHFGVEDRFNAVVAIGEELPFRAGSFDAIYSGGCIHHMRTEYAFAELDRVLSQGGRFSSVDPWKTVLHTVGTRVFGKRECGVFCRPIDPARLAPISLFKTHTVNRHGPFFRYPMIVLEKFGVRLPVTSMLRLARFDDVLGKVTGTTNFLAGSIMFAGEKSRSSQG